MKLSEAAANNTYTISSLECSNSTINSFFLSLGLYPGVKIKLIQNSPYKICSLGSSKVAISDNIAEMIYVQP